MSHAPKSRPDVSFSEACSLVEAILNGDSRQRILETVAVNGAFGLGLSRLRERMRTHVWQVGPRQIRLGRVVAQYDRRARETGFHLLHDWDGKADRVNEDIIPVDVLHFLGVKRGQDDYDSTSAAILLDYYLLYVLTLLSLAIWDDGDADANLDRLDAMVRRALRCGRQRPAVRGRRRDALPAGRFALRARRPRLRRAVDAGSHPERGASAQNRAWSCRRAGKPPQVRIRSHLRQECRGDACGQRRRLSVAAVLAVDVDRRVREDRRRHRCRPSTEDALWRLCSTGCRPTSRRSLARRRPLWFPTGRNTRGLRRPSPSIGRAWRPTSSACARPATGYSPFSFFFNFSQNVIKGAVVDALLWGSPWTISLNDLLTGLPARRRPRRPPRRSWRAS